MARTPIIQKPAINLVSGDVLVGDEGGRSVVYEVQPSSSIPQLMMVETEHGPLYLDKDPEVTYPVLDES